jgi:hypothetical protein
VNETQRQYVETVVAGLPRWIGSVPGAVWAVHVNRSDSDPLWPVARVETVEERDLRLAHQRETFLRHRPIDAFPVAATASGEDFEPSGADEERLSSLVEELGDDWDLARRLGAEAARRLNAAPSAFAFDRAPDFVVYCCSFDGDDLERDLTACLPPERFAMLAQRGWL